MAQTGKNKKFTVELPKESVWTYNVQGLDMESIMQTPEKREMLHAEKWYPISPYIRFAQYDVVPPSRFKNMDIFLDERVIYDYELLFIKSGQVIIRIEDEVYEGQPGDLFLYKPGQRHSMEIIGEETFIQPHIHFDLIVQKNSPDVSISFKKYEDMSDYEKTLFREDITEEFLSPFPNRIRLPDTYLIEQLIFDIIQQYENRQPYSQIAMQGIFLQIWYHLVTGLRFNHKKAHSNKMVLAEDIKRYLERNTDRTITMDQLANQFYINKYYISRLFKEVYDVSPIQYHASQRIHQALKLLNLTNMSITEIAGRVGYNSIHRFSKVFKSVTGVSPTAYRHTSTHDDIEQLLEIHAMHRTELLDQLKETEEKAEYEKGSENV